MNLFVQQTWVDLENLWDDIQHTILTDLDWDHMVGIKDTLLVDYKYEKMILIHDNVVNMLKVMFPPFTRDMFDLL